jgi:hypothetical protein
LPIKFEIYSYNESGDHRKYGEIITTVNKIKESRDKTFTLDTKGGKANFLKFDQFNVHEMPNFTEYLRSGWGVNMALAIDFTASNGDLSDPTSLHK